ncbi:MAG: ribonuclease P protein component [Patescibacteria group bacterium]
MAISCLKMLSQVNRLKNKKDFDRVFKKGKGFKEAPLFLKLADNNLQNSRFGFVIGKNVFKKATARNKIKRQLRELIRLRIKKITKGIDGVLVVSPGSKNFQELEEVLDKVLLRAKILEINLKNK